MDAASFCPVRFILPRSGGDGLCCGTGRTAAPRRGHAASLLLKLGHCSPNTQGQTGNLLGSPKVRGFRQESNVLGSGPCLLHPLCLLQ